MASFTVVDSGTATTAEADVRGDDVFVPAETLGWVLKPEGLCRDEICIPVAGRPGLVVDGGVSLERFSELLGRSVALDLDESAAYGGVAASEQRGLVDSMEAPDFSLPDLSGRVHSLSEHRGSKVLLAAWASW